MDTKINDNHNIKLEKSSRINKISFCVLLLIILSSELFLGYYIQSSITSESNEKFVLKNDILDLFVNILNEEQVKNAIGLIVKEFDDGSANFEKFLNRRKRGALAVDDNLVTSQKEQPNVEFFNPKLRHELEAKDEVERARTGNKGAAPGGDQWVWLTSYSRIPLLAIQGFCSATREYCPPGAPGPQGPLGPNGPKGEKGDVGLPGIPGPTGNRGPKGPPGDIGWPGTPGLDGRDGVPGEPGLDGVPGRSGMDGLPGRDGLPGKDGSSGRDGRNGTDGKPGLPGPQGPQGPPGAKGLTGPRGRPGKPGNHGIPGTPGITTFSKINGRVTNTSDILVPPSIAGSKTLYGNRPTVVHEGANVRLRCGATGKPPPEIEWRKADGSAIPLGAWQTVSVHGITLNLTRVNRAHMGIYQCVADNGIPPAANHTFHLEVHFPPLIRIRNQMVGAANGTTTTLECEVEAFPEAVRYWERADGRLLDHGFKYRIDNSVERDGYRSVMQLRILNVSAQDYAQYHCIAKNERGITKGVFTVYETDPRLATPPPPLDGGGVAVYGVLPPDSTTLEDLCPPPVPCPECADPKEFKCRDSGISLFDLMRKLNVRPYGNHTYPGYRNRAFDCVLYAVGKPVYHRFTDQIYGSWMKDPTTKDNDDRYWVTKENETTILYEYANKSAFRKDAHTKNYTLDSPFEGNSHVVYNGSFYYNAHKKGAIMKYELESGRTHSLIVPDVDANGTNYLYNTKYNTMDFNVDDNGLWVIYSLPTSNNTIVMKVDAHLMKIQYIWNINIDHHKVGEMFIVCGVLYAVDNVTERDTKIRLALDLYKNTLLDVNLPFTNPFRRTTMVGYNYKNKELYTWDKGNQLTYPIRYHEIGYNLGKDDKHEAGDESGT